jgi:UDP-GlcNAc:undecaprenyl-phosphate GlcNAc-1-phosphate transferase
MILAAMAASAFLLSWCLTPLTAKLAREVGVMDQPGARKVHRVPTPRLGGLAVFLSALVCSLGFLAVRPMLHHQFDLQERLWPSLCLGALIVYILGLYDDMLTLGVWPKITVQMLAAFIVVACGGFRVAGPAGIPTTPAGWAVVVFTFLWVVGVTNAFNLIDGLDGLAVGMGILTGIFALCSSLMQKAQPGIGDLFLSMLAGLLFGFLPHNFHPARVFLGNNGSMATGFLLSVLVLRLPASPSGGSLSSWLLAGLFMGVPLLDTAACMIRRIYGRVAADRKVVPSSLLAIFRSDRSHIHHRLLDAGLSHRGAVWTLYGLGAFCGFLSLGASRVGGPLAPIIAWLLAVIAFVWVWSFSQYRATTPTA